MLLTRQLCIWLRKLLLATGICAMAEGAWGQTNGNLAHVIDSLYRNDQLPYQRLSRGEITADSAQAQSVTSSQLLDRSDIENQAV